jgi:magnesium and cobalt exporter, CNNM family
MGSVRSRHSRLVGCRPPYATLLQLRLRLFRHPLSCPVRLATILNEYGVLEGIVTQTDLLEAIAGDLAQVEGEEPEVVEREDGSLLIDGTMSAQDAFERLAIPPAEGGFHTIAGFVLSQLGHLPKVGEHFDYEGWRFEVVDLDGRRIDKVLAIPPKANGVDSQ